MGLDGEMVIINCDLPLEAPDALPSANEAADDRVVTIADKLRTAIAERDYPSAIAVSTELHELEGTPVYTPLFSLEAIEAFSRLDTDPLLGLGLDDARWREIVDGTVWPWLLEGRFLPGFLAGMALAGRHDSWPALIAEREHAGRFPELRTATNIFESNLWETATRACAKHPAGAPDVMSALTPAARLLLASESAVKRPVFAELAMLSRRLRRSVSDVTAILNELAAVGLADVPARFESLAAEISGAELRTLASELGIARAGTKAKLVHDLMLAGGAPALTKLVDARGWQAPVRVGRALPEIVAPLAVAWLWSELAVDRIRREFDLGGAYPRDSPAEARDAPRVSLPALPPPLAPFVHWQVELPSSICLLAVDGEKVIAVDDRGTVMCVAGGVARWETALGGAPAKWTREPVLVKGAAIVTLRDRVVAVDVATGSVLWEWRSSPPATFHNEAVTDDERIIQASDAGLHALDFDGNLVWEFRRRSMYKPSASEGLVTANAGNAAYWVLDSQTGATVARHRPDALPRCYAPVLCGPNLVLTGYRRDSFVTVGVDARSAEPRWERAGSARKVITTADHRVVLLEPGMTVVDAFTGRCVAERRGPESIVSDNHGRVMVANATALMSVDPATALLGTPVPTGRHQFLRVAPGPDDSVLVAEGQRLFAAGRPPRLNVLALRSRRVPASAPALRWRHGGERISRVRGGGDLVLLRDASGTSALESTTGTIRWTRDRGLDKAVLAGDVVVAAADHSIVGLNALDGTTRWERPLFRAIGSDLCVANGDVFALLANGDPMCIAADDGRVQWGNDLRTIPDGCVQAKCAIVGDTFAWQDVEGPSFAVEIATGARIADASYSPPAYSFDAPVAIDDDGGRVSIDGSRSGPILVGEPAGAPRWEIELPAGMYSRRALTLADDVVIVEWRAWPDYDDDETEEEAARKTSLRGAGDIAEGVSSGPKERLLAFVAPPR